MKTHITAAIVRVYAPDKVKHALAHLDQIEAERRSLASLQRKAERQLMDDIQLDLNLRQPAMKRVVIDGFTQV
jgi:hypothetical protein